MDHDVTTTAELRVLKALQGPLKDQMDRYRDELTQACQALENLRQCFRADRLTAHLTDDLRDASASAIRALAQLDDATIAYAVTHGFCPHCGRSKQYDRPYCDDHCMRCAELDVPEGAPCAMHCVRARHATGE